MGIQGLIPLLEKSWRPVKISEFSGCTVAIDAYCWLHKGVYTCAEKLARGEDCQTYVYYCMRYVTMLLAQNIKPILVFDGQYLPAKAETELKRRNLREQNRRKAAELMRLDKGKEASSLLRRSIDVTHKMALNLIKKCREINVDCIVAPYEADSQLAYLNLSGIADIVITEDSDLLLFGCKKVLFKLDQNGGGLLIEQDKIHLSMNMRPEQFSFNQFRYMCILSGCDYLPSIPGVGLAKARQFICRSSDPDIYKNLSRLGSFMNVKVPPQYRDQFMNADRMFLYQPVYDPLSRQIKPLNEISDPSLSTLISKLTNDEAYQLALGNLDPFSLEVVDNWDPDIEVTPSKTTKNKIIKARHQSIWSKNYQPAEYNFNECNISTPELVKGTPIRSKINENITLASPIGEPSSLKKLLPVTEDDIISTLEEIDENEKNSNDTVVHEKHESKKSKKDSKIIEKILVPEIGNVTTANEMPTAFKQLSKRKCTVIDSEKQVVSGYFSSQKPTRSEIIDECINPFKCRKITISKNEETSDDLNISINSIKSTVENKSETFENEKITMINTNTSHKNMPNTTQNKAFSWKNYSNSKLYDELKSQKMIPQNSQNDDISINDSTKSEIENDVDEGFCSQNSKELNDSKSTPKPGNRSHPRPGLSKNIGKNSQSLLSKFGFKTSEKLKH